MKIKNIKVVSILFSMALALSACTPTATTTTTTTPTDGSQSAAQLAGSGTFCLTDTTIGGTLAYTRYLSLAANGTYSYAIYFSDAGSCATAQNTGGNNIATYTQGGTYAVGGTATTPSTGTKIVYTVTSASMTTRKGTYGGNATLSALVTWMNANCSPSPGFSTIADGAISVLGNSCTVSGSFAAVTLPASSATYDNTVYRSGTSFFSGVSTSQDIWRPGGTTYPTSYTQTYLTWQ
jgi:hypothetical protein